MMSLRRWFSIAVGSLLAQGLQPFDAWAGITGITITQRAPAYGGISFAAGPYEMLTGTATGEIDPNDPLNAVIADIGLAPVASRGHVEYTMDIGILKSIDEARGNGVLVYDVVNRGNPVFPVFVNAGITAAAPAGDGFVEDQGYTVAFSGWQGDLAKVPGLYGLRAPVAVNKDGSPIIGTVRTGLTLTVPASTQPLTAGTSTNTLGYPVATADLGNAGAVLTQRVHQHDAPQVIPNANWAFADCRTKAFPGTPSAQFVCLGPNGAGGNGFDTDHIYELVYKAKNPIGLGFAAMRDVVAFLRSGDAQNPLKGAIHHAQLFGLSQSGRFARNFLDLGFNQKEKGGRVFEGLQPVIASAQGGFNVRFGQPGRLAGTEHTEKQYPGLDDSLSYQLQTDPYRKSTTGLLLPCVVTATCPKVINMLSDTEYWSTSGAIDTTDVLGRFDANLTDLVRFYQFSSTQHVGAQPNAPTPASRGLCEQVPNVNSYAYNLRALTVAMTNWIVDDTEPPASVYSRVGDGTLVRPSAVGFPAIPGVTYDVNSAFNTRLLYDRGPLFNAATGSGIAREPPVVVRRYPDLLPQVDADGNDVGGLRSTTLQVPLGTYTGWNTRAAGFSQGDSCDLTGSYIPFASTEATRTPGDPRRSVQARYGNHDGYVAAVTAAANRLLSGGYLLPQDAAATITAAQNSSVLR